MASMPPTTPRRDPEGIRLPWSRSDRPIPRRLVRPLQSFLEQEAAGGILLLIAAALALVWANSPWRDSYGDLWATRLSIRVGGFGITEELRRWVNDGLMAVFFLVVTLEIKREFLTGELRDRRAAVLPALAAIGGMVVPALVYLAFNPHVPASDGWGAAMPTDIAFAIGVLALAFPGAPTSLRAFLLTLAIVDDLGSIVVIALYYSGTLSWTALLVALGLIATFAALRRIHVRATLVYAAIGIALWAALHGSGVSPTLAGVVVGLLVPAVPFQRPSTVSDEARRVADLTVDDPRPPDADAPEWLYLADLTREAVSPLARAERVLHPWASWVVLPLFALANAGISLGVDDLSDLVGEPVAVGLVVARVLAKPAGILLAVFLAIRVGAARLPSGTTWAHLTGIGAAAGIPFAVSLFVADIAFGRTPLGHAAVVGTFAAAVIAGFAGFFLLRNAARRGARPRVGDARDDRVPAGHEG